MQQLVDSSFDFFPAGAKDRSTSDEHSIPTWAHFSQVMAYGLSQQAFGPIALDRTAKRTSGAETEPCQWTVTMADDKNSKRVGI
jgi:hypothetical protein